jgi:hypothetical protein
MSVSVCLSEQDRLHILQQVFSSLSCRRKGELLNKRQCRFAVLDEKP